MILKSFILVILWKKDIIRILFTSVESQAGDALESL